MHWESFYVDPKNVHGKALTIAGDEAHHLARVLRKQKGDSVWAVDGQGTAYEVQILHITRNEAQAKILQTRRRIGEPVAEISLAQGILKGERFDWLVEKATEIGVRTIIPLMTENAETVAGPQKLSRWKRVAMAAMKQSGRSVLPEVTPMKSFEDILSMGTDCHCRLISHSGVGSKALAVTELTSPKFKPKALILVGPEGGFTESEVEQSRDHGFQPISLGSRRLRGETAGIVVSSLVLSRWGELE